VNICYNKKGHAWLDRRVIRRRAQVYFNLTRKLKCPLGSVNTLLLFHNSLSVYMFHFYSCSVNYVEIVTSFVQWFTLGKSELVLLVTSNLCISDEVHWTEVQSSFKRLT
jgi:hypothetical protein